MHFVIGTTLLLVATALTYLHFRWKPRRREARDGPTNFEAFVKTFKLSALRKAARALDIRVAQTKAPLIDALLQQPEEEVRKALRPSTAVRVTSRVTGAIRDEKPISLSLAVLSAAVGVWSVADSLSGVEPQPEDAQQAQSIVNAAETEQPSIESLWRREVDLRPTKRLTLQAASRDQSALAWHEVLSDLTARLNAAGRHEELIPLARRFVDYAPSTSSASVEDGVAEAAAWPLDVASIDRQKSVLSLLRQFNDSDRSRTLSRGLERLCRSRAEEDPNSLNSSRELVSALFGLGSVLYDELDYLGAMDCYAEALSITRRILEEHGSSPNALHDVAVALQNLADASRRAERATAADDYDREALSLSRAAAPADTSVEHLQGDTHARQLLRDMTASINRVANLERRLGRFDLALELDNEGYSLSNRILACEVGRDTLRNVAVFASKVASDKKELGMLEEALADYTSNIGRFERIEREYGGADSLWDLSWAHREAGVVAALLGQDQTACHHYLERLKLLERLQADYGDSARTLRGLAETKEWLKTCKESQKAEASREAR